MAQLTPDDCLYPRWRLKADVLWPGLSGSKVRAILSDLLIQGYAAAAALASDVQDAAARWYTAYLAYDGRYQELVGLPSTVDVRDEGSSSYVVAQMQLMRDLRDEALEAFQALVDTGTEEPDGTYAVVQSYR